MNHHKRIILDFDDTLAFHTGRDFANSKPNKPLIEKTNKLFDQGWIIDIFTARGSVSCKTRAEAEVKYRAQIEDWLETHNVCYHTLSFDKPLAAYYIDDKGMTPEVFLEANIFDLTGGLSGSDIYTDGKLVHKTDENSINVSNWYTHVAAFGVKTPQIHRLVSNTISMEYIDHEPHYFIENPYIAIGLIQQTLDKFRSIPVFEPYTYDSYVERIKGHADLSGEEEFKTVAKRLAFLDLKQTFSHGDFGITNMLFKNNDMYLIDPIPNVFGCVELDCAKFIASLMINGYGKNMSFNSLSVYNSIEVEKFKLLIAAEIIRVYKYHPEKEYIRKLVSHVLR